MTVGGYSDYSAMMQYRDMIEQKEHGHPHKRKSPNSGPPQSETISAKVTPTLIRAVQLAAKDREGLVSSDIVRLALIDYILKDPNLDHETDLIIRNDLAAGNSLGTRRYCEKLESRLENHAEDGNWDEVRQAVLEGREFAIETKAVSVAKRVLALVARYSLDMEKSYNDPEYQARLKMIEKLELERERGRSWDTEDDTIVPIRQQKQQKS